MGPRTERARAAATPRTRTDPVGADLALVASPRGGERVAGDVFVDVDGLGVLAEVVEAGEPTVAVALERPFTGVFSAGI